jgi:hypothetical protein
MIFRRTIKLASLLAFIMLAMQFSACKRERGDYYNYTKQDKVYSGNVLKYLQENGFDSMLVVLNRYPDIIAKLNSDDSLTLFAIPNKSFELAIANLNKSRAGMNLAPRYLSVSASGSENQDSALVDSKMLKLLISRYVLPGIWDFDKVYQSLTGVNVESINYDYSMNLKGVQQNSTGSVADGPKIIEFSDMNYSFYTQYWKPTRTSSVNTVRAKNVLVHTITENHEFGFASFSDYMNNPRILRDAWRPYSWHSQNPSSSTGGTVFHVMDNNLGTFWQTRRTGADIPPPPYWFIMDMRVNYDVSSVAIRNQSEWSNNSGMVVEFYLEFAPDGKDLTDSASWKRTEILRMKLNEFEGLQDYQRFYLNETYQARYFKFTVVRTFGGINTPYADIAEIWLF